MQIHNWEKLLEESKSQKYTGSAREDLGELLKCVMNTPELEAYFEVREANLQSSVVTYDTLWTLFGPGTKIIAKLFLDEPQVFTVHEAPIPVGDKKFKKFSVIAWCWDWNGKKIVKSFYQFSIDEFPGKKYINELSVYPVSFGNLKEKADHVEKIRVRADKYYEMVNGKPGSGQMWMFDGIAILAGDGLMKHVRDSHYCNFHSVDVT